MRELTKQIIPTEEIPKSRNNSTVQVTQPPTKTPKVILSKEAVQPAHNKASKVTPNKEVTLTKTDKNLQVISGKKWVSVLNLGCFQDL